MAITRARGRGEAIGDAARASGVHLETIRYYERIGLVPPPARAGNGRRVYDAAAIRRLAFIRRARELGFALDEIRELLVLAERGACGEVKALTERHLQGVRAKLADLARLEAELQAAAGRCDAETAVACPILEALAERPARPLRPAAAGA
jgi:MerR family mercuric resistance operon transcriptional regulator